MRASSLVFFLLAVSASCGGGNSLPTGPSPVTAEVEFQYVLAEAKASSLEGSCNGAIRLHPSFWGFAQVTLQPLQADAWGARFEEVPIGRHSVRLDLPAGCAGGELVANGVVLSRGSSVSGFAVATDGSVAP
ncbi:MAG TPA: hypothetical protein VIG29_15440 [Vicinamibacteria bacterium]